MTMPFGRYKGTDIEDLPLTYLRWLQDLHDLREPLATAVDDELRARSGSTASTTVVVLKIAAADIPVARELVQAGRRACAVKHHPDTGGNTAVMVSVNVVADRLLAGLDVAL